MGVRFPIAAVKYIQEIQLRKTFKTYTEMEKRADGADASVLFFSLAVLIFWLCTCKLDKTLC